MSRRMINVDILARVEGEGALDIELEGKEIRSLTLRIFEPPRFFEAFLQGRHCSEVPDIVARICGICPVAYQMSAVHAFEKLFAVEIDPAVRALRRLLYCGEWIESHALHIYMLQAPDFLGLDNALQIAESAPELLRRGLRLKKVGDTILERLGGRAIHPVSVRIGGFSRVPARGELTALLDELLWAQQAAEETLAWVQGLDFPDFTQPYLFCSLKNAGEYPMNEGEIAVQGGDVDAAFPTETFEAHFAERHVAYSNALQSHYHNEPYLTGPLARLNANRDRLPERAKARLAETGLALPLANPFHGIIARAVEMLAAIEEAIAIIEAYAPPARPAADFRIRAGACVAATEAPRGVLYHRYGVDENGLITAAKIVPPTAQNQSRIEADLRAMLPAILDQEDEAIALAGERLIRCYDPCISCATHFLRLSVKGRR